MVLYRSAYEINIEVLQTHVIMVGIIIVVYR